MLKYTGKHVKWGRRVRVTARRALASLRCFLKDWSREQIGQIGLRLEKEIPWNGEAAGITTIKNDIYFNFVCCNKQPGLKYLIAYCTSMPVCST